MAGCCAGSQRHHAACHCRSRSWDYPMGRGTAIAAVRVGVGFMADKIGVHTLSDHGPRTSPPLRIAEAVVAFPLPCSSWQGLASFHAQGKQDCSAHVAGHITWPFWLWLYSVLVASQCLSSCYCEERMVPGALKVLGLFCSESSFWAAA